MRFRISVFVVVVVASLLTLPAQAQYFGQNKVQWENFDFKTLRTEHFDIYYYETEADVVHDVGRMAERWYSRLSRSFNHSFARKPIVLYANSADFHQTTTTGGPLGEGTGGFTDAFMNRVVLPLTGDMSENDHVLGHEIVHVFQYDIAAAASKNQRRFNLNQLPLWLVEGMAEYFSKGRVDPLTAMWIRDATINNRLPDLKDLSRDPRYFPYRYGQALMAYIGARFGDDAVVRYFRSAGVVGVEEAFERAVGLNAKQLFADWQESARELYNPILQARGQTMTQPLIGRKPEPGKKRSRRMTEMNVGPALSPDGQSIAFLSARELFSIDLFLADAKTGKVIRRLVSGDRDAHFESLRFIESAGAFSPDGKRLAFITFAKGDNYLGIVDVETRNVDSISVPGIDAILNVAWSPDGRTIAIAGQMTGVSDLFLYNLGTKEVRRLTDDKFADLQPAFSPDGRMIVFATDRGGSNLGALEFGELGLAIVDVATGVVRELNLFADARHLNPHWSPDGRAIYFIANPEGIPDIYRYSREDGTVTRITSVQTGVSGITDTAPALTVATRSGDIAFSMFEGDNYNIYTLPNNAPAQTASLRTLTGIPRAAILPPLRAAGSEITTYLSNPEQGLPPQTATFEQRPYEANLHLAYLGPPTIGASVGGGYNAVGGTVSAYFTDILGQHNVGLTFQGSSYATSSITDQLAGEVFYLNQKNRWAWGADLVHIPYVTPFYDFQQNVPVEIDGRVYQADVYSEIRQIQTFTNVSGITQYPFGTTRRIEGSVGYLRYALKEESEDWYVVQGQVVDRRVVESPFNFAFNWYTASTAFVGDSSTFGFVSPIRGTRYRYEVETLTGDLSHTTALADWRKYFYKRPATLAIRGLHYGRYGSGAEDGNLRPLFLGSGSLVRAYEPWTIDPNECALSNICERLLGSRLLATSVELRAPLLGTPEFGLINASFLPTEIFAFADAGVAWSKGQDISFKYEIDTTEHTPVFSAGVGLRILLSYIPIEVYVARPFQRPHEDLVYGFNITPGW